MIRLGLALVVYFALLLVTNQWQENAPSLTTDEDEAGAKPSAVDEWTTSRVRGFPEPPPPFQVERVYPELTFAKPLGIWTIPGTRQMLVAVHQSEWGGPGRLLLMDDDQATTQTTTLLERPEIIYGIAFHPDFEENGFFYIGCNGRSDVLDTVCTRVLRFQMDPDNPFWCDPDDFELIIEWPSNGHNGGDLAFGPDGMLYITSGDGTSDSDTLRNGQNLATLAGSLLRIDVNDPDDGRLYSIPEDNPFLQTEGARPEAWAYGLRNPWRMTFDPKLGHLWVGINGQDWWETVQLVKPGENYGWSITEGSQPFQLNREQGPTPIIKPTIEHHHSEARSLTGGRVYYGDRLADLDGTYIYGDYSTGTIWGARHDGEQLTWHQRLARSPLQITGFGIDPDGDLLIVDHGGGLYRLTANEVKTTHDFPRRLSETGLYSAVAAQQPHPGVIPYDVNSPLWSDGASKLRWVAIPAGKKVNYHARNSFEFPEGSVIVKSFSFDLADDDVDGPVPVETRLLVKEGKEWYGYSYAWNQERTDALLVEEGGRDQRLLIHSATTVERSDSDLDGEDSTETELNWRYPSRTECMVCHTRAANFVLGLSVPQLNRDVEVNGKRQNQLDLLAERGFFSQDELPQTSDESERLANPYDEAASLEDRARSYMHANCSYCHMEAGGGNSSIDLQFHVAQERMKAVGEVPTHDKFDLPQAHLLAPGRPSESVLLYRISQRGKGQMPPLATEVVDEQAVQVITEWVESLKEE